MLPSVSVLGHDIGSYSICAVIGIIVASAYIFISVRERDDLDSIQLINIAAVSGLGAFFGAHLLFAFTKLNVIIRVVSHHGSEIDGFGSFVRILIEIFGGMVFYGGLIGGFLSGIFYVKYLKHIHLDSMVYADVYAPAIPLFHFFGRIGCFLGGCCYGIESRWGFIYTMAPIPESNGVVRLPIQLIESAGNLLIFIILHRVSKKEHYKGFVFTAYILMYSSMRFVLEFFRGDSIRGFLLGLSTSQWISIMLAIAAMASIVICMRRNQFRDTFPVISRKKHKSRHAGCSLVIRRSKS